MSKKLTQAEQLKLLNALPAHRKSAVKSYCKECVMRGEGVGEIIKMIGKILGPIVGEISPAMIKKYIIPFIEKSLAAQKAGNGLILPGNGLKLAGQGRKKKVGRPKKGGAYL